MAFCRWGSRFAKYEMMFLRIAYLRIDVSVNKLHAVTPRIWIKPDFIRKSRREQVLLCRLTFGQADLTHSYLLKGKPQPDYVTFQCTFVVKNISYWKVPSFHSPDLTIL